MVGLNKNREAIQELEKIIGYPLLDESVQKAGGKL